MDNKFLKEIVKTIGVTPTKISNEYDGSIYDSITFIYYDKNIVIGIEEDEGKYNIYVENYGKEFDDITDGAYKLSNLVTDDCYLIEGMDQYFIASGKKDCTIIFENLMWFINSVRCKVRSKTWLDDNGYAKYSKYDFSECFDVFLPENKQKKKKKKKKYGTKYT